MGKLTLLLLVLLGWLQYSLWFGKNGIHDYVRIKDEVEKQEKDNLFLKSRNDQLFAEIKDLKSGQQAIEERARNELGMIKPGESFYRMVPDTAKQNSQQSVNRNTLGQNALGQNTLGQNVLEQNSEQ
ncbi:MULTISPECIES: cell division protein FtsB [Xenorhabdus]|uniref:cell division protein FtsB n=1 Tax=Xenorhabdus TaxID=626 RepID=UPI0009DCB856|nr:MULTISPECIES: cell division protein FtsB [Xenorhabdus]MBC8945452.1 cell division protein FtsB [Xenorhabdus indica]